MTSVAYRIFYSHKNQGQRSLLNDDEINLALMRFPDDCQHRLPSGSTVSVALSVKGSSVFVIHSPASVSEIQAAVKASADSLYLYGELQESVPPIVVR